MTRDLEVIELVTERLVVRTPKRGDGLEYARYYLENRDFLQPWSPTFRPEMFSERDWESSITVIQTQLRQGIAIRYGLFLKDRLVGVANLTDIKSSPLHSCVLGYTLCKDHQGLGLMREALQAIIGQAFSARNVHRITANYMPRNERSGRLLRHLGFQVEGYARDYLLIDGRWEDHVLTGLANPEWHSLG
jgi:ribosomal-protein-alanine N-acetyltransferase